MKHKKMHAVIAEAGVQWDPDEWNGDIWAAVDSNEVGSRDEFVDVRPAWRRMVELDADDQEGYSKRIILSMK